MYFHGLTTNSQMLKDSKVLTASILYNKPIFKICLLIVKNVRFVFYASRFKYSKYSPKIEKRN